jgi:hypothetical protein
MFMKDLSVNGFAGKSEGQVDLTDQFLSALRPLVPWGAHVVSIIGDGGIAANVILAPGPGLAGCARAAIVGSYPLVNCIICAELRPTPRCADFHGATLRWAIRNADRISIWSPDAQVADEKYAADACAVDAGANFILTIETPPAVAPEWATLACRHKRTDAKLVFYKPENPDDAYARALAALD